MERLPAYPADRLTDRTRTVLRLARKANQDKKDLTPRSLLVGMCQEGSGVAGRILARHNVDATEVFIAIEPSAPSGWSMVHFSKTCQDVAASIGHNYIGTEHLLIAMTSPFESAAKSALTACGINPDDLREDCLLYTSPSPRDQRGSRMPSSA